MAISLLNQVYVRPISVQDTPKIVNFKKELENETDYLVFNMKDSPNSFNKERNNIIQFTLFSNYLYLGAFVDDTLGGLLLFRGGKSPRNKHIGELGIGIKKEYWGHGIGKKLIAELFKWCVDNSIKKVTLKVRKDNSRAIALYQKLGFKCEAIKIGFIQGSSEPFEFLIMAKTFN